MENSRREFLKGTAWMAVTSQPGICAMRCTAGVPRLPTPITPTRTRFIGATRNPCIDPPAPKPSALPFEMHPAAIAATPIHAVPLRNSLLLFSIFTVLSS